MVDLSIIENISFGSFSYKLKDKNVILLTIVSPYDMQYLRGDHDIIHCQRLHNGKFLVILLNPQELPNKNVYFGCNMNISPHLEVSSYIIEDELKNIVLRVARKFNELALDTFLSSKTYNDSRSQAGSNIFGIKVYDNG